MNYIKLQIHDVSATTKISFCVPLHCFLFLFSSCKFARWTSLIVAQLLIFSKQMKFNYFDRYILVDSVPCRDEGRLHMCPVCEPSEEDLTLRGQDTVPYRNKQHNLTIRSTTRPHQIFHTIQYCSKVKTIVIFRKDVLD